MGWFHKEKRLSICYDIWQISFWPLFLYRQSDYYFQEQVKAAFSKFCICSFDEYLQFIKQPDSVSYLIFKGSNSEQVIPPPKQNYHVWNYPNSLYKWLHKNTETALAFYCFQFYFHVMSTLIIPNFWKAMIPQFLQRFPISFNTFFPDTKWINFSECHLSKICPYCTIIFPNVIANHALGLCISKR